MATALGLSCTSSASARTLNAPIVGIARTHDGRGYWLAGKDGGVFSFGDAPFYGSASDVKLNAPVVGIAAAPDGRGYWLVAADGGVFGFGDARFHGSLAGYRLNAPVVGIAPTPDGGGYWLAAGDGGVFSFGDAHFYGSAAGVKLNAPVVGIAATPDGGGYWLGAADGGVFNYGDSHFYGSAASVKLNAPVVGIAATPDGGGYWLGAADGGVFNYGDARFAGSEAGHSLSRPVSGIAGAVDDGGYWLTAQDGGIFSFGSAPYENSVPGEGISAAPVGAPPAPPTPGGGSLGPIRRRIVDVALGQLGYNPSVDGCARYSISVCRGHVAYGEWCSVFATWTWEQASVPIPIFPYSGDPYVWAGGGRLSSGADSPAHTYVIDRSARPLPGDLVFFGSPTASAHVAIVTQVLPDGAIVTLNGNDSHNSVGPSTFFPPKEAGLPPVYGYASPVASIGASADIAAAATVSRATLRELIGRQDPPAYKRALARAARSHPAFEHMPHVGPRITIEVANYLRSHKIVLQVIYRGSRLGAVRGFHRFLHRYHDRGREYLVHYRPRS